jgi:hypothetical protein
MRDSGLSRASEDASSLVAPSPRAVGPYAGGAACRFVVSRWPWRLRLLPGTWHWDSKSLPSMQRGCEFGSNGSARDTGLHGPPSTSAVSCAHASQWTLTGRSQVGPHGNRTLRA